MYVKHLSRVAAGAAVAVALGVGLSACGSHSSNGGGGAGSGGGSAGSVVVQAGQGPRLSGTYSALDFWGWVPNDFYPQDITGSPDGAYNTNSLVRVNRQHDFSSESCAAALQTAGGPGYGEEAYLLDQGQNSAQTDFYAYGAYEFPDATQATAFVHEIAAKFAACGSFTDDVGNGQSFPASMSVGPSSEAAAVSAANAAVDLRESATNNGKTVVGDLLIAADGNVVVVLSATSSTGSLPAEVDQPKLADVLLNAFAKGEQTAVSEHIPSDYTTSTAAPTLDPSAGDRIGGEAR